MVFDQLLPLFFVARNPNAAGAAHSDGFEVLGSHYRTDSSGRVGNGVHNHGHGYQVFTGLTDGGHDRVGPHDLGDRLCRPANARPPEPAGILNLHLLIDDR